MAEFLSLSDAISRHVRDGDVVAMEGFTHLIPFAAGHEVIRQGRKRLTLIRMTPDLIYDQLIGMGAAEKLIFSWGGNPGVGSLHRLRDAVENDWPAPLKLEEHSHAAMANAYEAGAANLPFAVFRGYKGVDLPKVNPNIRSVTCPYTGEELATVPAIRPDVAIIHALRADRAGNVLIEGIVGVQKEAVLAAKRSVVTVEEVVDDFGPRSPQRGHPSCLDDLGDRRRAGGRVPLLRARLLQTRQRLLQGVGRDRPRPRDVSQVDRREGDGEDGRRFRAVCEACCVGIAAARAPPPCGEGLGRGLNVPHSRIEPRLRGYARNNRMASTNGEKEMWRYLQSFRPLGPASADKLRSAPTLRISLGCLRGLSSRWTASVIR